MYLFSVYFSQLRARLNAPGVLIKIKFYDTMIFKIQQTSKNEISCLKRGPKEDVASYDHAIFLIKLENMSNKLVKLHFPLASPKPAVWKSHPYKTTGPCNNQLILRDRYQARWLKWTNLTDNSSSCSTKQDENLWPRKIVQSLSSDTNYRLLRRNCFW